MGLDLEHIFDLKSLDNEERIRRKILVRIVLLTALFGAIWGVLYLVLDLKWGGITVLSYVALSSVNLLQFYLTKKYNIFRLSQLILILILPMSVHLSLGGFSAASGVVLASFLAPLGALMFDKQSVSRIVLYVFAAVVVASGVMELSGVLTQFSIGHEFQVMFFVMNIVVIGFISYFLLEYFVKQRDYYQRLLQERNKDLTDSITYAKHIQTAIFPSDEEMNEIFNSHLLFFRPKDIVSGDFYWIHDEDDKLFFTAADCTGHGVPGAMVSVLGANALNRSVKEFKINKPSDILKNVSDLFNSSFRKSKKRVNDGMDLALCVHHKKSNRLEFSGAYNPLYILRDNKHYSESESTYAQDVTDNNVRIKKYEDCHLIELIGDKNSIGRYSKDYEFRNWVVDLKPKDRLFVFSDGYADQFGGPKGKKFKYSNLKKILSEHYTSDFPKLKNALVTAHDDWRGELEQLDDVCLLGVEF